MTTTPTAPLTLDAAPEQLKVVAWTEKHTMSALRATASYGAVKFTDEYGPYDIDRPTFHCDRLVEAIVALRDAHWAATIAQLEARLREAEEYESAKSYASYLATALFKSLYAQDSHYASGEVIWGLCDTLPGILTQIDNMVAGLVKPSPRDAAIAAHGKDGAHD